MHASSSFLDGQTKKNSAAAAGNPANQAVDVCDLLESKDRDAFIFLGRLDTAPLHLTKDRGTIAHERRFVRTIKTPGILG